MKINRKIPFAILCCAALLNGSAAETLFDFENASENWKSLSPRGTVSLSGQMPVKADRGLMFTHPKWQPQETDQQSVWPAFETRDIRRRDWSGFNRLVIPIYNDSAAMMLFCVLISDSKTPLRQGAGFRYQLPPHSGELLVLPLTMLFEQKKLNASDIAVIHCFSENPGADLTFLLDEITLLKPGEAVPPLPAPYLDRIRQRQAELLAPFRNQVEQEAARLTTAGLPRRTAQYLEEKVRRFSDQLNGKSDDGKLLNRQNGADRIWQSIRQQFQTAREFEANRQTLTVAPGFEDILLGYATPMEKILPRAASFGALPPDVVISAARNEKEAFQLIVLPTATGRKCVKVRLTAFQSPAATLPSATVSVTPVGFTETKFIPKSGSDYVGFYPDPLLSFLDGVEIKAGEAQPFWIRADIPADQPAGTYCGSVEIEIDGVVAFSFKLAVQVRDFTLPEGSPLPLAITFWPRDEAAARCNPAATPEQRRSANAPCNAWKRHKKAWAEMLSDYFITFASLYDYSEELPDFEILATLKGQHRLGRFNLGYFPPATNDPADRYGMQKTIDRLRPRYEKAKALGILAQAYLYGCDEARPDSFERADRAAAILKAEFPEVPIFSTAYDESFGLDGRLGSIDWFCPLTAKYDPRQAALAREAGKQVWWYICLAPGRPYANNFLESTGIETRLLMGAMTAKYRPDGFLYYQTSLWNNVEPITSGPFTDWIAESYPNYNGDGSWTYPGPDGTPLGSIRLENFRDGLEDYAYVKLLEEKIAATAKDGADENWLKRAEAALNIPESLVKNPVRYTQNPQELYAWRARLADLLESAPK